MKSECVFCGIANGEIPAFKIWEDANNLAFLSIYPNTEGFTVVIPKKHYPSYAFDLPEKALKDLIVASRKVAKLLDSKLADVGRTGMILEGFGVNHAHTKLFPMHGTSEIKEWRPLHSKVDKFFRRYEGYISSHDYKRASDKDLEKLATKIKD